MDEHDRRRGVPHDDDAEHLVGVNELAEPRAVEDPDWLDAQLAESARSLLDVTEIWCVLSDD